MKSRTQAEPIRTMLMRCTADKLGAPIHCPARGCHRNRHCQGACAPEPPCQQRADPADRARFDELFSIVEAIRNLTLWPEPSRSDDLRALEALAIDILIAALPLMPDFAPKFENWLKRYGTWPARPRDTRFWLKLAREEIARPSAVPGSPGRDPLRRNGM